MSENGESITPGGCILPLMNDDTLYKAMLARDHRFDGLFYVGVKTTGIYCRPICPAKPKRENVEFFSSATIAEEKGYRPCLRCRPESAPQSPVWMGKSAIVQRALRVIATTTTFDLKEEAFAEKFGVSARHLRRLFMDELGQTPKKIYDSNRLGFARKLIVETGLPMTAVAMTAGFSSLRRFNDAFKKRFHRAPRELRLAKKTAEKGVSLSLSYRPPFNWEHLLGFYRAHLIGGVEEVTESSYARHFRLGKDSGHLLVTHDPKELKINLSVECENPTILFAVAQRVRQMFDLDSDPLLIANCFQTDPLLSKLWLRKPGLRVARGWDPFESAVCTILGQLVSLAQARKLVHQLVSAYGSEGKYFPEPKVLAEASLAEVRTTENRKAAIRELARRVVSGELDLHSPQGPEQMKRALLEIPGLGPWSAEYICLRALGHTDSFPKTDLILKRVLEKHPKLNLDAIKPWRSYAAVYLWNEGMNT